MKKLKFIWGVGLIGVYAVNMQAWVVTNNPSGGKDWARAITSDATYLYVAGDDAAPGNEQLRIEKRNKSDGALQWAQTNNPSTGSDNILAITSDATYLYVAGGEDVMGSNSQWWIEKRNLSDGALQWAQTSNPTTGFDVAFAITCDTTYLYVAGCEDMTGSNSQWRIEKRNLSDGALQWVQTSNPSTYGDVAFAITCDTTYLYISGSDGAPGEPQWRIEKRNKSDGALQWAQTSNPSTFSDAAYAITCDATYLYVSGYDIAPGNYQWRIEKRNKSDGALQWAETSNPSTGMDIAYAITCDATYLYVAGRDDAPGASQWRIEKRNISDGALQWVQTDNPSTGPDMARAITRDTTLYLYVAGYDNMPGNAQWRIEQIDLSAIEEGGQPQGLSLWLSEPVPNPFTQSTIIRLQIPDSRLKIEDLQLQICDLGGQVVKSFPITNNQFPITRVVWDGKDNDGKLVRSGIYFCSLISPDKSEPYNSSLSKLTRKLIRIK